MNWEYLLNEILATQKNAKYIFLIFSKIENNIPAAQDCTKLYIT